MTNHTPQGLPPLLDDLAKWEDQVRRYDALDECNPMANMLQQAREALAAQAATLEAICKIIECAGPEAADEIADLLGYPSVEWPSDQAASVEPVALMDLIQQHLTSAYACTRVWEAWSVGTMSEDDFTPLAETDFAHDLAGEIAKLYASAPPPASVQDVSLVEKLAKRTCEANADSARFTIALQTLRASLDPDDWMGAVTMHNYIDAVLAGGSPLQQHPAPSPAQATPVCGAQNAESYPQAPLSLTAAPQEWSPAYTRGPARQSAPVAAVPALVQLTEEQMLSAVRPLCNTGQVAERLVAVSIDEYRAIEAASAKLNGLTVGDGAQPIKDTP